MIDNTLHKNKCTTCQKKNEAETDGDSVGDRVLYIMAHKEIKKDNNNAEECVGMM